MKFCYCPECDQLRPSNWYARDRCEICGGECVTIRVKRSIYGFLMYLLDIVAVVLIGLHLAGPGDFFGMGIETLALLIFLLIGLSLVMAYLDLGRTTERARERLRKEGSPGLK